MSRWEKIRIVTELAFPVGTMLLSQKFFSYIAFLERGYESLGSELFAAAAVGWLAYKAIDGLYNALEDYAYELHKQKSRSRRTEHGHSGKPV